MPGIRATSFTGVPSETNQVAYECPRSWKRSPPADLSATARIALLWVQNGRVCSRPSALSHQPRKRRPTRRPHRGDRLPRAQDARPWYGKRTAHRPACRVGEDLAEDARAVELPMGGQQSDHEAGKWHFTPTGFGLGIRLARDVTGDLHCCSFNPQGSGFEVNRLPPQARALSPAQARASRQADQRSVPAREGGGELFPSDDPIVSGRAPTCRKPYALARVGADDPVTDRRQVRHPPAPTVPTDCRRSSAPRGSSTKGDRRS
ncbi:hypothetical protein HNR30_006465 [Nonomuraea soli]|uniref:Uncharacterized protein n=1 Tax=Nonomuraea soli TaxID=1032476 RepID=A0A7W0CPS2_9ACTN|nr:hypothetical protein [Nonomuraea soli]